MIAIVLATYNGQSYLQEQIDSIRAQTVGEWTLFVSDDNSTDETPQMLQRMQREDPRIRVLSQPAHRLGPTMNFARAIERAFAAGAEYVALCDQDDVWFPTKLESQLKRIRATELASGRTQPTLVHSDAQVVDTGLNPIAASRHRFSGSSDPANIKSNPLERLLLHAYVQGCTAIMNRPLLELILPVPAEAVSHDWWCSLCAAAAGVIDYIPHATLKYRQHGNNCIGAQHGGPLSILQRILHDRQYWRNGMTTFAQSLRQSAALHRRLLERNVAESTSGALIEDYCDIVHGKGSRLGRIWKLRQRRIPDVDWLRLLASYARVMLLPEKVRLRLGTGERDSSSDGNRSAAAAVSTSSIIARPISMNGGLR